MKRLVDWKVVAITLPVASLIGWGLHWWSGLGFWPSLAIVIVALAINAIVALVEDELPGGFGNPKRRSHSDESR